MYAALLMHICNIWAICHTQFEVTVVLNPSFILYVYTCTISFYSKCGVNQLFKRFSSTYINSEGDVVVRVGSWRYREVDGLSLDDAATNVLEGE